MSKIEREVGSGRRFAPPLYSNPLLLSTFDKTTRRGVERAGGSRIVAVLKLSNDRGGAQKGEEIVWNVSSK